jgi:hypothetical protein
MKVIDFKTSAYFPGALIFSGAVLLLFGVMAFFANIIAGSVMCLIGLLMITTHYRLRIDLQRKVYQDYLWIFGLKKVGETGRFNNIEYLFIRKNKVSQTMSLRVASSTIRKEVFDGYLKFSENVKIHVVTKDNKDHLIKKLSGISALLNVKILDYSDTELKEV